MKKIAKLLKADFNESSDLASIAAMLASKGRGKDTILAHITPREADILKAAGGSGTTNPETGLLEFQEVEATGAEPYTTAYDPPSYDIGFGPNVYEAPGGGQFGSSPTNAQIEQQIGYSEPSTGGGLRATPAAFTEAVPSAQPLRFGAGEGIQATTPSTFGPQVPAAPSLGYGVTDRYTPTAAQETPSAPQEKSFFDKLTTEQMVRLGLAGGLGLYGATQAKKGAQQAQQAAAEQKAVGAPYQAKGKELIRAAESGELTPTSQQQLQALQARLAQGAETRGGVGAAQVAAQAEAYRQQLLSQQYNLGLQVSNIGDQIALGAIRTGLQADQALNQASTNFYTNLAAIGAGIPITQTRTA
jgi:hypothetical protein